MVQDTIILPTNSDRVKQLQQKLAEYRGRVDPFRAPETQQDAVCKAAILGTLLEHSTIRFVDLLDTVTKNCSGIETHAFLNAWEVIDDYVGTGGKHVHGGHLPPP